MSLEEVLAAGGRHRGRGADLERQRGRGDDLREAVDRPAARAADRGEPVAGRRQRRAAADGADLEAAEADRRLQAALHAPPRAVRHRARADHAEILARRRKDRGDRRCGRERDRLHAARDRAVRADPRERLEIGRRRPQHAADLLVRQKRLRQHRLAVSRLEELRGRLLVAAHVRLEHGPLGLHRARAASRTPCSARRSCASSCSARRRRRSSTARARGTSGRRRAS